jgi:phospholipase/lecithinase/hemolysin
VRKQLGLAVVTASLSFGGAQATTYTALYSFGDSLSDVGNVYAASKLAAEAGQIPSPYPISPPYYNGRFSNGPNWVDDLPAKLGLGPVTPSANSGNDFAVGGAQTGPTSVNPGVPLVDLNYQVQEFKVLDPSPTPGALYTLDIGANDIGNALSAYAQNPSINLESFVAQAATNTIGAIDDLYADGARNLLYYEVPDLSVVPDFKAAGPIGGELAEQFNTAVLAGIKPLEATGLTVFDVPIFSTIDQIVANPAAFGLTNVSAPCFSGNYSTAGSVCADPDQSLFWDGEHPTAAAHALTADVAYDVLTGRSVGPVDPPATPEASTWAMMLIGFAGLSFASWRARGARLPRVASLP